MQLSPNGLENETRVNDSTALLNRQQVKINTLIERLAELPSDKQRILEELDALKNNNPLSTSLLSPPLAPEQDWSIDGLFNVHLNHYLYITADFNIANMSLAEQASKSLIKGEPQQIESIRFSQNRRVISKEIHYFDHPFMGMIVQIRRHKRVLPKVDTLEGLE